MEKIISLVGNLAAVAGILICLASGSARVMGHYLVNDYSTNTLFQAGVGLMVLACLLKIETLLLRQG